MRLDENILNDIKRINAVDIIQLLRPGFHTGRTGRLIRSPFREDSNPSFSCYRGSRGDSLWKDQATGESGDNVELYRRMTLSTKPFGELVDEMSWALLGKSAYAQVDSEYRRPLVSRAVAPKFSVVAEEQAPVYKIVSAHSMADPIVPQVHFDYWRSRGISDDVLKAHCLYFVIKNTQQSGKTLVDKHTLLPLVDKNGEQLVEDGLFGAVGMYNEIGGVNFRTPDTATEKGLKRCTASFISIILANGERIRPTIHLHGEGNNVVEYLQARPDGVVMINGTQGFVGLRPEFFAYAKPFLDTFRNRQLSGRDVLCVCAVLSSINSPCFSGSVVVEGLADGLSDLEIISTLKHRYPTHDLVILNSINNRKWAVPFLALHRDVNVILDKDMKSGAGQMATAQLISDIKAYNKATGTFAHIVDGSDNLCGHKDLNDSLMASKGLKKNF